MGIASLMYHKKKKQSLPVEAKIYGVKINTLNTSPEGALTYTDDAIGMLPAKGNNGNFISNGWADIFPFNQIKPCLLKDGAVVTYLNPNDFTQDTYGNSVAINNVDIGDVMIEFPKIYWNFETVENELFVRYSNVKVNSQYKCLAHTKGNIEKDKLYISAYLGYKPPTKNRLTSISSVPPTSTISLTTARTLSKSSGNGYENINYFQHLMLQVLFIVMFKNRDSQTALGKGLSNVSTGSSTGQSNRRGMYYGSTLGTQNIKFCGIEDFWGNYRYWVDGFYISNSFDYLISTVNYNDTGIGYMSYANGSVTGLQLLAPLGKVTGTTETGFIFKAKASTITNEYCDTVSVRADRAVAVGGYYNQGDNNGAFSMNDYTPTTGYIDVCGRLVYM